MAPNSSYPTLSWKAQIHQRVDVLKFCVTTDNAGLLHAIVAQDLTDVRDHATAVEKCGLSIKNVNQGDGPPFQELLVDIGSHHVNILHDTFVREIQKLEKVEHSKPDEIKKAIQQLFRVMKQRIHDSMDTMERDGIEVIERLPSNIQDTAADIFKGITSAYGTYTFTLSSAMQEVVRSLWNDKLERSIQSAIKANETAAAETKKLMKTLAGVGESSYKQRLANICKYQAFSLKEGFDHALDEYAERLKHGGKKEFDKSVDELFKSVKANVNKTTERARDAGKEVIAQLPGENQRDAALLFSKMTAVCTAFFFAQAFLIQAVANAGYDHYKAAIEKASKTNKTKADGSNKSIQDLIGEKADLDMKLAEADYCFVKNTKDSH